MTRSPLLSRLSFAPLALLLLGAGACDALNYTADFADNSLFYADVPFVTKAPGDRPVFVAPIHDAREGTVLPLHDRGFPIRYGTDEFWERPVPEMFSEVLVRQLEDSEMFPAVLDHADPEALVLKPTLMLFTVGAKEGISGSMTFAEVGLRVEVFGPVGADGERPRWHDHVYGNRQVSEMQVNPVSPYRLIGRALQLTMSKTLSGLDGSNVARSDVPVEAVEPALASPRPAAASARLR
ncbi:MAG TPA: hypothetical protein ENI87_12085 [bacterium]|nr:hypothetical protein [bacterium]